MMLSNSVLGALAASLGIVTGAALSTPASSSTLAAAPANPRLSGNVTYMFTFGDSYTTTNFNSSGIQPSPDSPFGNPQDTFTNWVYYLTETLNSSLTLDWNYARGSATINQSIVPGNNISFQEQVEQTFLPIAGRHPVDAPWTSANSIAGVFIGINDVEDTFTSNETTFQPEIDVLQASYFNIVGELYNSGLRNFYFLNVPPLQYSQSVSEMGAEAVQHWTDYSELYNSNLAKNAKAYQDAHPDVLTYVFDNNAVWKQVLANPTGYGFKDNSSIGEWADSTVLWNNGFHPSAAMHKIVAERLAPELHQTFGY